MNRSPVRVGIVEDHPLFRETIASLLATTSGFEVAFDVDSTSGARERIEEDQPHLVVVDLWLQDESGLDLVAELDRLRPEIRCVVISGHRREAYAEQALAAGARGYILKGDSAEFLAGLRRVVDGGTFVSDAVRGAAR